MSRIESLRELINVRVLNLNLIQLEEAGIAIACIEAGESVGGKTLKLIAEIENLRASAEFLENRCYKLEAELDNDNEKIKASESLQKRHKNKIDKLTEEKEELEFAINNLRSTILRIRNNYKEEKRQTAGVFKEVET